MADSPLGIAFSLVCAVWPQTSSRNGSLEPLLSPHTSSVFPQDSLAAEIEGTMRKELQLEEPESPDITYDRVAFIFQVPSN